MSDRSGKDDEGRTRWLKTQRDRNKTNRSSDIDPPRSMTHPSHKEPLNPSWPSGNTIRSEPAAAATLDFVPTGFLPQQTVNFGARGGPSTSAAADTSKEVELAKDKEVHQKLSEIAKKRDAKRANQPQGGDDEDDDVPVTKRPNKK